MTAWDFYRLRVQVLDANQAEIAALLGKSARSVSRWENGEVSVPFLVAERMIVLGKERKEQLTPSTTDPASEPPSGQVSRSSSSGA